MAPTDQHSNALMVDKEDFLKEMAACSVAVVANTGIVPEPKREMSL